jgi:hypothetical protein
MRKSKFGGGRPSSLWKRQRPSSSSASSRNARASWVGPAADRDRLEETVPEAHVDEVGLVELHAQHEVTPHRDVARDARHHPTDHAGDLETRLGESPSEEAVHLVAPATASLVDDLPVDPLDIEIGRSAQLNVEVLVGDAVEMCAVESAQTRHIGGDGPREPDAVEIGGELHEGQLITARRIDRRGALPDTGAVEARRGAA